MPVEMNSHRNHRHTSESNFHFCQLQYTEVGVTYVYSDFIFTGMQQFKQNPFNPVSF